MAEPSQPATAPSEAINTDSSVISLGDSPPESPASRISGSRKQEENDAPAPEESLAGLTPSVTGSEKLEQYVSVPEQALAEPTPTTSSDKQEQDVPVPEPSSAEQASPAASSEKRDQTVPAPELESLKKQAPAYPALAATLSNTDVTIQRLNHLLSSSAGLEKTLATINYTSHILHHLLTSNTFLSLLIRLHLRTPGHPHTKTASATSSLLSLSSLISETRTTLRLFGLFPLWSWGASTLQSPPEDPVLRTVAFAQVGMNVVYQAMENVAYLASKGIVSQKWLESRGPTLGRWYIWSTRAWLGHVLLEFVRLARERALRIKREEEAGDRVDGKVVNNEAEVKAAKAAELRSWKKSLVNNLFWAPLCVHWSLEQGAGVPDQLTGFISFMAGAWGLRDMWAATALS